MPGEAEDVLTLEVATPTGLALRAEVSSVQAPSVRGEFGVLPGHLPLLAALKCGVLKYTQKGKDYFAAVGSGFVEAEPDKVLILADVFAPPDRIDVDEVKHELAEAEDALAAFDRLYEGAEYNELQRNVDWALARLEVADMRDRI